MTHPDHEPTSSSEYPFFHNKIPVADSLQGFIDFIEQYPEFNFCPYVADKNTDGWNASTSRVYMNQVLPDFLYVPVNIPKDDLDALRAFFDFVQDRQDIPAVNITQPHKSSPVLRQMFWGDENADSNVDTLIRDPAGQLKPYDLNAPAFVSWFNDEIGSFKDRSVVLIGVGGVGEPMAKHIAHQHPHDLILIDPVNKEHLAKSLNDQTNASYHASATELGPLADHTVIINAAGKEGATDNSQLAAVLRENTDSQGVFVDIRPHLTIDIVEQAKALGWAAHTGHGMNARNDYVLLQGIARNIGVDTPSFKFFEQLVANAS